MKTNYTVEQLNEMGPCERLTAFGQMINEEKKRVSAQFTGTMDKANLLISEMSAHFNTSMTLNDAVYNKARLIVIAKLG